MRKQPRCWIYYNHTYSQWGIETDEPSLTFDGHYICLIPPGGDKEPIERAEEIVEYLKGAKQFVRD